MRARAGLVWFPLCTLAGVDGWDNVDFMKVLCGFIGEGISGSGVVLHNTIQDCTDAHGGLQEWKTLCGMVRVACGCEKHYAVRTPTGVENIKRNGTGGVWV